MRLSYFCGCDCIWLSACYHSFWPSAETLSCSELSLVPIALALVLDGADTKANLLTVASLLLYRAPISGCRSLTPRTFGCPRSDHSSPRWKKLPVHEQIETNLSSSLGTMLPQSQYKHWRAWMQECLRAQRQPRRPPEEAGPKSLRLRSLQAMEPFISIAFMKR